MMVSGRSTAFGLFKQAKACTPTAPPTVPYRRPRVPRLALSAALFSLCVIAAASTSIADDVVLTKGKQVVTASIGNEGFLAYQFDVGRKKPFILPVAAAGG